MHQLLVVDDELDICDVVKAGFEARGSYRVFCATNKLEACAVLRRQPLDLALLDILMRENAGGEIEALAGELHVPVVRMTGHPDIMRKCLDQNLPILMKPFRVSVLIEMVDYLLAEAVCLQRALQETVQASQRFAGEARASAAVGEFLWGDFAEHWQRICQRALVPRPDRP